jgi:hypothetical protein
VTVYQPHIVSTRAAHSPRDRVARLLKQYPNVSDQDRREILSFMKEARHLEVGLLTSNEQVRPQLDRFIHDNKRHFSITVVDVVRLLAVFAAVVTVVWLLWEVMKPGAL